MIHATVIGNLGSDAERRVTQSGKEVVGFSIGTRGREKDGPTTWVRCSMWGARGVSVQPYLKKGGRVAVSGTIVQKEHNGKQYLDLDVQELELLGDRPQNAQQAPAPSYNAGDPGLPF